jgi:hypothetical protein
LIAFSIAAASIGCHPQPVLDPGHGPKQPPEDGTLAGTVASFASGDAIVGRRVTAMDLTTRQEYEAVTGENGGFTLKVPRGWYHVDVDLQPGESVARRPKDRHIKNSDLDANLEFVIRTKAGG